MTLLEKLKPCPEWLDYIKQFSTLEEAWNKSNRSDWMWWILRRTKRMSRKLPAIYAQKCIEHMNIELASYDKSNAYYVNAADVSNHANKYNEMIHISKAAINAELTANYARWAIALAASAKIFYNNNMRDNDAADKAHTTVYNAQLKQQANILRSLTPNPFKTL